VDESRAADGEGNRLLRGNMDSSGEGILTLTCERKFGNYNVGHYIHYLCLTGDSTHLYKSAGFVFMHYLKCSYEHYMSSVKYTIRF